MHALRRNSGFTNSSESQGVFGWEIPRLLRYNKCCSGLFKVVSKPRTSNEGSLLSTCSGMIFFVYSVLQLSTSTKLRYFSTLAINSASSPFQSLLPAPSFIASTNSWPLFPVVSHAALRVLRKTSEVISPSSSLEVICFQRFPLPRC